MYSTTRVAHALTIKEKTGQFCMKKCKSQFSCQSEHSGTKALNTLGLRKCSKNVVTGKFKLGVYVYGDKKETFQT